MLGKFEKQFSQYDVYEIIDRKIKEEMARKTEYIQKNGYKHTDVLKRFDTAIYTLSSLYREFDKDGTF